MPGHTWEISVHAGSYFPALSTQFPSEDIGLSYDDEQGMQFFAYSAHVDDMTDTAMIARRLYSLQTLLNGVLRLNRGRLLAVPIEFNHFASNFHAGGAVSADDLEEYPFDPNVRGNPLWSEAGNRRKYRDSYVLELVKHDNELRTLVFLIGLLSKNSALEKILAWSTLYKIYESVKSMSDTHSFNLDDFASGADVNSFTAGCNNMSVIGLSSRHGLQNRPTQPRRALSDIDSAFELILKLANKFFEAFMALKYP